MAPRLVRLKESGVSVITQARPRPGFSLHFRAGKIATLAVMLSCGLCSFMNFMSYGVWFRSVTVGIQVPEPVLTCTARSGTRFANYPCLDEASLDPAQNFGSGRACSILSEEPKQGRLWLSSNQAAYMPPRDIHINKIGVKWSVRTFTG
jgi:hypothetical protein